MECVGMYTTDIYIYIYQRILDNTTYHKYAYSKLNLIKQTYSQVI